MTTPRAWFDNNTMVLELANLTDDVSGAPVVDATVTVNLVDRDDTPIPGGSDIAVPLASGNTYRATAPNVEIAPGVRATAIFTATATGAIGGEWHVPVVGTIRYA